ncbi:TIGR03943 family protein [Streptomyces sp. NPDC005438]|uniref:TIGR03943 family putative permease subunit n=1 Tax=Streptomyces sp. NPDC005438 TaxID=3156880 RepID=UPI0033B1596E
MKRNIQTVLMLLIGTGLLHSTVLSDVSLRYVKDGLRPYLILSAAILLLMGAIGAVRDGFPLVSRGLAEESGHSQATSASASTSSDQGHDHDSGSGSSGHGHDHSQGPAVAWLLFLPALALLFFSPPALGSYTASRGDDKPAASQQTKEDQVLRFSPLPPGKAPAPLTISEFSLRLQKDRKLSLKKRQVALTGFVTPAKSGDGWYLSRLVVSCCAADAETMKVRMHGTPAPPADSWVVVTGTWHPKGKLGTPRAEIGLDVANATRVPQPPDPYMDKPPAQVPTSGSQG